VILPLLSQFFEEEKLAAHLLNTKYVNLESKRKEIERMMMARVNIRKNEISP